MKEESPFVLSCGTKPIDERQSAAPSLSIEHSTPVSYGSTIASIEKTRDDGGASYDKRQLAGGDVKHMSLYRQACKGCLK
jgi:hypothetical protein